MLIQKKTALNITEVSAKSQAHPYWILNKKR